MNKSQFIESHPELKKSAKTLISMEFLILALLLHRIVIGQGEENSRQTPLIIPPFARTSLQLKKTSNCLTSTDSNLSKP